jgi:hypothetical protein
MQLLLLVGGRCHRHGQTKPVHVKCYYAPVSVESRLLEWRKRASKKDTTDAVMASADSNQEAKIVYATLDVDDDEDHQSVVTVESSDEESGDDDDYKPAAVDKRNDSDRETEVEPKMELEEEPDDGNDSETDQTNFLLGVRRSNRLLKQRNDGDSVDE